MQLRERRAAIRKYCLKKQRRSTHIMPLDTHGWRHEHAHFKSHMCPEMYARKDKYEKKILWFWVDVAVEEGTRTEGDKEELERSTELGEALAGQCKFGLGKSPSAGGFAPAPGAGSSNDSEDDEGEDSEDPESEETDEGKTPAPKPKRPASNSSKGKGPQKKPRCNDFVEELPEEDIGCTALDHYMSHDCHLPV